MPTAVDFLVARATPPAGELRWDGDDLEVTLGWNRVMELSVPDSAPGKRFLDALVTAAWLATGLPGLPSSADVTLDIGWVRIRYTDARQDQGQERHLESA